MGYFSRLKSKTYRRIRVMSSRMMNMQSMLLLQRYPPFSFSGLFLIYKLLIEDGLEGFHG